MKSSGSLPVDMLLTVGENAEPFVGERVQYLPTCNEVEAMETYYNIKVPIDETGPLTHKFLSHNKSLQPGGKCWIWRSQLIEKDGHTVSSIVRVKRGEQAEVARIQHWFTHCLNGNETEFLTVNIMKDNTIDDDSGLFVVHSEAIFEQATVPFLAEYVTKPLLTARDKGELWVLN